MALAATYESASGFTLSGDRTVEFPFGVRVQADCGTDGWRYGTVVSSGYAADSGRSTVLLSMDAAGLTANLTGVLHGNDIPASLVNHGHTGQADGGAVAHGALSGIGTHTHAQIDAHIADTANPHGVTAAQTGAAPALHAVRHLAGAADQFLHAPQHAVGAADPFLHAAQHAPGAPDALKLGAVGECYLSLSGSNLLLSRHNGYRLLIDDAVQVIPAAGVTLAPTGLTAATTYYIYAAMVAGAMALEASTTGHVQDGRNGVEAKAGDPTRTLVGLARTDANAAWVDTAAQRFLLSQFNRRDKLAQGVFATTRSSVSTSLIEISPSERTYFLTWGDEPVVLSQTVTASTNPASGVVAALCVDTVQYIDGLSNNVIIPAANYPLNMSCGPVAVQLAEGHHYAILAGFTGNGVTMSFYGSASPSWRCAINATVRG